MYVCCGRSRIGANGHGCPGERRPIWNASHASFDMAGVGSPAIHGAAAAGRIRDARTELMQPRPGRRSPECICRSRLSGGWAPSASCVRASVVASARIPASVERSWSLVVAYAVAPMVLLEPVRKLIHTYCYSRKMLRQFAHWEVLESSVGMSLQEGWSAMSRVKATLQQWWTKLNKRFRRG
jgi:hypothetical protein